MASPGILAGSGTLADPFLVACSEDLAAIGTGIYLLTKVYRQTADIDWADNINTYFPPIGGGVGTAYTSFVGTYDGGGFSISNLLINQPGDTYVGLFAYVGYSYFRNIHLINVTVNGLSYVGGLAGYIATNYVTDNCSVTGNVTGTGQYVGGLIGLNSGRKVSYCNTDVNVIGNTCVGGLIGQAQSSGGASDCHSHGSVVCNTSLGGGLVGALVSSEISGCYSTCAISSSAASARIGGAVGEVGTGGIASNCYARGNVTCPGATCYVGGLVGTNFGILTNCYATGIISHYGSFSGIAAYNGLTITDCFWDLETSGYAFQDANAGLMKTTAEMYDIITFSPTWDIVLVGVFSASIWFIDADYPKLAIEYVLVSPKALVAKKSGSVIHVSWAY